MKFDEAADHLPHPLEASVGFGLTLLAPIVGIWTAVQHPKIFMKPDISAPEVLIALLMFALDVCGWVLFVLPMRKCMPVLFHASQAAHLREIKPMCLRPRHPKEGKV